MTAAAAMPGRVLTLVPITGVGEVQQGDDLAVLISSHVSQPLCDGDVVVVTSKVVSKALGLAHRGDREAVLFEQTDRVVARRGPTQIVRTNHGLTMAAAGIDASNTAPGSFLTLPADPDLEARTIRRLLKEHTGARIAVVISDTVGRAWRSGQTDIAIGSAGLTPGNRPLRTS